MLKDYFKSYNILTDQEIDGLIQKTKARTIKNQDYFIRENSTCKEVAFVTSGIFRSFYVSDKGAEITYCITFPNNLMTAYSSFITGEPTVENIQAITDVELLVIQKSTIEDLVPQSPNWTTFLKVVAEQQYLELEKRIFQLQKNNAQQRYADLLRNHPEYVQHVPLHYLASYLGITQRHLSRIRKEMCF